MTIPYPLQSTTYYAENSHKNPYIRFIRSLDEIFDLKLPLNFTFIKFAAVSNTRI